MNMQFEEHEKFVDQMYDYAADLLVNKSWSTVKTKEALMEKELNEGNASLVVYNLNQEIKRIDEKTLNKVAEKDMLYGTLWCLARIDATYADFGYIFWEQ